VAFRTRGLLKIQAATTWEPNSPMSHQNQPPGSHQVAPPPPNPSSGGIAQLVERVLYHSTRRAVPERSWVQSLLPSTEVEPGFSAFGGMLVPVLQLISPVCKTGTSLFLGSPPPGYVIGHAHKSVGYSIVPAHTSSMVDSEIQYRWHTTIR
jgi:hypothetical protein